MHGGCASTAVNETIAERYGFCFHGSRIPPRDTQLHVTNAARRNNANRVRSSHSPFIAQLSIITSYLGVHAFISRPAQKRGTWFAGSENAFRYNRFYSLICVVFFTFHRSSLLIITLVTFGKGKINAQVLFHSSPAGEPWETPSNREKILLNRVGKI